MRNAVQENRTATVTDFLLLGFGELHGLQIILFLVFLVVYILTILANFLTILLILTDLHLHTPMYFFLGNLSCLEMIYSSTIVPKMLASLLTGDKSISLKGCMTQLYFFGFLASTECCLLSVMSYDRFLAICRPLHYATSMKNRLCIQLAAASWINSMVLTSIYSVVMSKLWFCGPNEIDHFFCESLPLIGLSCSDTTLVKYVSIFMTFILTFLPFILTVISYACIINTISRIPSSTGRQKAFSTCSSHLIVVSLFYGTLFITYLMPESKGIINPSKFFSVLYTVLPPFFNPVIYSLRNRDVKEALNKLLHQFWKVIF
ncbi:PREDICTED: olfactory receptor 10A7-like [Thamnophis sirtalis]|uniref:Olfactory receptor n=1 Tax=Thamnophis sirtalis TaxID=35019 RepID=A0A6I9Y0Z1_9SAUR|nr:PREDICTED: olfactory receptor 10A7-like [Thamnophis sirtalis]XP_032091902.1 olfactory receptor 10A7-like [Thamnophis elegans]